MKDLLRSFLCLFTVSIAQEAQASWSSSFSSWWNSKKSAPLIIEQPDATPKTRLPMRATPLFALPKIAMARFSGERCAEPAVYTSKASTGVTYARTRPITTHVVITQNTVNTSPIMGIKHRESQPTEQVRETITVSPQIRVAAILQGKIIPAPSRIAPSKPQELGASGELNGSFVHVEKIDQDLIKIGKEALQCIYEGKDPVDTHADIIDAYKKLQNKPNQDHQEELRAIREKTFAKLFTSIVAVAYNEKLFDEGTIIIRQDQNQQLYNWMRQYAQIRDENFFLTNATRTLLAQYPGGAQRLSSHFKAFNLNVQYGIDLTEEVGNNKKHVLFGQLPNGSIFIKPENFGLSAEHIAGHTVEYINAQYNKAQGSNADDADNFCKERVPQDILQRFNKILDEDKQIDRNDRDLHKKSAREFGIQKIVRIGMKLDNKEAQELAEELKNRYPSDWRIRIGNEVIIESLDASPKNEIDTELAQYKATHFDALRSSMIRGKMSYAQWLKDVAQWRQYRNEQQAHLAIPLDNEAPQAVGNNIIQRSSSDTHLMQRSGNQANTESSSPKSC